MAIYQVAIRLLFNYKLCKKCLNIFIYSWSTWSEKTYIDRCSEKRFDRKCVHKNIKCLYMDHKLRQIEYGFVFTSQFIFSSRRKLFKQARLQRLMRKKRSCLFVASTVFPTRHKKLTSPFMISVHQAFTTIFDWAFKTIHWTRTSLNRIWCESFAAQSGNAALSWACYRFFGCVATQLIDTKSQSSDINSFKYFLFKLFPQAYFYSAWMDSPKFFFTFKIICNLLKIAHLIKPFRNNNFLSKHSNWKYRHSPTFQLLLSGENVSNFRENFLLRISTNFSAKNKEAVVSSKTCH